MTPTTRFEDALVFAARLHREQRRKSTDVPYIAHLLAVTALVLEYCDDEDTAIAALLHDAIEDQGGAATRELIRERFGQRVVAIVDGSSDTDETPKPPWRARKERYLAHLATAPPEVLLVTTADKLHNARAILADYRLHGEVLWARFNAGREEQLWFYRSMVQTLTAVAPVDIQPLVEELARVVDELQTLMEAV
jgi:(p)ppGpp synthase/HD superfamily hydrolase